MTWHFADGDWTEYGDPDCICGHLPHDEECPEEVRMGGVLRPCGCGEYCPTSYLLPVTGDRDREHR